MNWLPGLWLALFGAIVALVWARITKWYELLILGGFGLLTGALLAGAHSWNSISISRLWGVFFG
ncbi:hypothetical protein [Microbispora sp. GKU 823]|uniref:hypothetical protein n=1 Tax=Microbispora sp. GKU 823 TaxID=1652100 RepID=UPI0009A45DA9|nr:hypothetical protein [Microbispora sp. GKU 823]OPG10579.1 hypothetical protein B1L11_23255 [Microbispora sp. GKU 823]